MPSLFLSYRREDTAAYAGRLFDRLTAAFGRDQVFMDIERIGLGADFVKVITNTIGSCDCVVVLIGARWLSCEDQDGSRRLDDPEDFVRLEVAASLDRETLVIPVLVDGARMPEAEDLPEALRALVRRNALEVSHGRFHQDVDRLIEAVGQTGTPTPEPAAPAGRSRRAALLAGAVAAGGVLIGALLWAGPWRSDPLDTFAGTWEASVRYSWLREPLTERLVLSRQGDRLFGTMSFLEAPRNVQDLTLTKDAIAFNTRWTQLLGSDSTEVRNLYRGVLVDDGVHFVMADSRGYPPLEFTARLTTSKP